jgi:hypothetical protein
MLDERHSALSGSAVVYECRRCGTAVSSDAADCPNYGTDSIARYRIE